MDVSQIMEKLIDGTLSPLNSYMALKNIRDRIDLTVGNGLHGIALSAIEMLERMPEVYGRISQYLYREVARIVMEVVNATEDKAFSAGLIENLTEKMTTCNGARQSGIAEALGMQILDIKGPMFFEDKDIQIPQADISDLLKKGGSLPGIAPKIMGRSLVFKAKSPMVCVIKTEQNRENALSFLKEAKWIGILEKNRNKFADRFDLPRLIGSSGRYLVRIKQTNGCDPNLTGRYALGLTVHEDYFHYPNDPEKMLSREKFCEVTERNARILGKMASMGIIQTAPIPLFHNRIQASRRLDAGYYKWWRRGRLDRWFHSCAYPNMGVSGIRDFEHLCSHRGGGRELFRFIGTHLLSLILVICSYFRIKEPGKMGLKNGQPVDARYLFDRALLEQMVENVFCHYYFGFTGKKPSETEIPHLPNLIDNLIDKTGKDRYMTEILRRSDQMIFSESEFASYLCNHGYKKTDIAGLRRGVKDIEIMSGPHLGEFNNEISIPELVQFLWTASALCMAGRMGQC